jgi:hypothetical protein
LSNSYVTIGSTETGPAPADTKTGPIDARESGRRIATAAAHCQAAGSASLQTAWPVAREAVDRQATRGAPIEAKRRSRAWKRGRSTRDVQPEAADRLTGAR